MALFDMFSANVFIKKHTFSFVLSFKMNILQALFLSLKIDLIITHAFLSLALGTRGQQNRHSPCYGLVHCGPKFSHSQILFMVYRILDICVRNCTIVKLVFNSSFEHKFLFK